MRSLRLGTALTAALAWFGVAVASGCGDGAPDAAAPGPQPVARAPAPTTEADAEGLAVDATLSHGLTMTAGRVVLDSEGGVRVTLRTRGAETPTEVAYRLPQTERVELARSIVASGYFEDPPNAPSPPSDHAGLWSLTISLGDRTAQARIWDDDRFRPVTRRLHRMMQQARVTEDLRGGTIWSLASALRDPVRYGVPCPADLVPSLCECIVAQTTPSGAFESARLLTQLVPPGDWTATFTGLLSRMEGPPRDAAVRAWIERSGESGDAAGRAAAATFAFAEISGAWRAWATLPEARRGHLRFLLEQDLLLRDPRSIPLAEEMVRTLALQGERFLPPGLARMGPAAVPMTLRLLAADDAAVRRSGVWMADLLLEAARPRRPRDDGVTPAEREALAKALAAELIPALERRSQDADEDLETRKTAFSALAVWTGRDPVAERREESDRRAGEDARRRDEEAAAREAQAAANRPPRGDLTIDGRVLGPGDTPLPELLVVAQRNDGPPENPWRPHSSGRAQEDGSFRIEGLVEGEFRLSAVRLCDDRWQTRELPDDAPALSAVRAGARDAVLRFTGAMVRGRVVDESGRAVSGTSVQLRMRDAPNVLTTNESPHAWSETDRDGRFLALQLLPGTYDLTIPGHPYLGGAAAIEPGPDVRTITILAGATLTGRVVDDRGEALADAIVSARPSGTLDDGVATRSRDDGSFELRELDPELRYDVFAVYADGHGDPNDPDGRGHVRYPDCSPEAKALELRVPTDPELRLRIEYGPGRCPVRSRSRLRLSRVSGGDELTREFRTGALRWRRAPPGTWRVEAVVRDLDAAGADVEVWRELGTVTTGDPERTFPVR